jgi:hypothetical protein
LRVHGYRRKGLSNCRIAAIATGVLPPAKLRARIQVWPLRATLIKSTLISDLLILLRKHRIKAALVALAHSRLN